MPTCRSSTTTTRYLLTSRFFYPKFPKRFQHLSSASKNNNFSAIVPPSTKSVARDEVHECYNRLDLNFENSKEAFKSKTNYDLIRGLLVFRLCTYDFLVTHNQRLLHILRKTLGAKLFQYALKATFYGHFVAGETQKEVAPIAEKLSKFGVKAILDYSVETDISQEEAEEKAIEGIVGEEELPDAISKPAFMDQKAVDITHQRYTVHKEFGDRRVDVISARTYFYAGETECDKNVEVFCNCIDAVAETTKSQGFIAIKLTALGRPQLLLKLSETIAQTQNFFKAITGSTWENLVLSRLSEEEFMKRLEEFGIKIDFVKDWFKIVDFDEDGFVDFYDWGRLLDDNPDMSSMFQVINIKSGRLEPLIFNLSKDEHQECTNMMQRLVHIADYATTKGVRIMIDAEQTYFQPAISRLTMALMRKYNKNGGQILNTYQTYLKSALNTITIDMHLARRENFHFGCKLVRGAYMDQERKRAAAIGYEDPINANYAATSDMYNRCLERIVDERDARGTGHVSVMVASHNEESVQRAVQLMKERCIAPSERVVCFAQLYGMCDQVSFPLGQAGYSVYKYLPYGPVEEVLPYLSRRAQENGSLLKTMGKERRMLWEELKRRLFSGQFIYTPPTPSTNN